MAQLFQSQHHTYTAKKRTGLSIPSTKQKKEIYPQEPCLHFLQHFHLMIQQVNSCPQKKTTLRRRHHSSLSFFPHTVRGQSSPLLQESVTYYPNSLNLCDFYFHNALLFHLLPFPMPLQTLALLKGFVSVPTYHISGLSRNIPCKKQNINLLGTLFPALTVESMIRQLILALGLPSESLFPCYIFLIFAITSQPAPRQGNFSFSEGDKPPEKVKV